MPGPQAPAGDDVSAQPTPEEIARVQAWKCSQDGHFLVWDEGDNREPVLLRCRNCERTWQVTS